MSDTNETRRMPKIGDAVVFITPLRVERNALVTEVWGETCVNLAYISDNPKQRDPYGQQMERESSCVHISFNDAKAHCWKWSDE